MPSARTASAARGNVQRGAHVRQDNSIGYFLPSNLGGFYGQVMVAAGENGTSGDRHGRYIGGQFGFPPARSTSLVRTRKTASASSPLPALT